MNGVLVFFLPCFLEVRLGRMGYIGAKTERGPGESRDRVGRNHATWKRELGAQ